MMTNFSGDESDYFQVGIKTAEIRKDRLRCFGNEEDFISFLLIRSAISRFFVKWGACLCDLNKKQNSFGLRN